MLIQTTLPSDVDSPGRWWTLLLLSAVEGAAEEEDGAVAVDMVGGRGGGKVGRDGEANVSGFDEEGVADRYSGDERLVSTTKVTAR